jgi:hypothetical protein
MDEASAAQTIEQPCTPHGGFPYTRFSFWNLQSMGLRWRSWVQSALRRITVEPNHLRPALSAEDESLRPAWPA